VVPPSEALEHILAFIDDPAAHAPTDPAEMRRAAELPALRPKIAALHEALRE
jgi:hypothetical protein